MPQKILDSDSLLLLANALCILGIQWLPDSFPDRRLPLHTSCLSCPVLSCQKQSNPTGTKSASHLSCLTSLLNRSLLPSHIPLRCLSLTLPLTSVVIIYLRSAQQTPSPSIIKAEQTDLTAFLFNGESEVTKSRHYSQRP